MHPSYPFWSNPRNRAVVYVFGLLLLLGSYMIGGPESDVEQDFKPKKTKLEASISTRTEVQQTSPVSNVEPREQKKSYVESEKNKVPIVVQPAKPNTVFQKNLANSPSVTTEMFSEEEICSKLPMRRSGEKVYVFFETYDQEQDSTIKDFRSFNIQDQKKLENVFGNKNLTRKIYKLCQSGACKSSEGASWVSTLSPNIKSIKSGDVYLFTSNSAPPSRIGCLN